MKEEKRYYLTVGLALFLLVANQIYVQYALGVAQVDAHTINIAGRQRMLTQRLSFELINDSPNFKRANDDFSLFYAAHNRLINGIDTDMVNITREGVIILDTISPYLDTVQRLISKGEPLSTQQKVYASTVLNSLLVSNDKVVSLIEAEHQSKVSRVRGLEIAISLLTVFVVVYEIFFVFLPTFKRLKVSRNELVRKSVELSDTLRLIRVIAHDLRTPLQTMQAKLDVIQMKIKNSSLKLDLVSLQKISMNMSQVIDTLLSKQEEEVESPRERIRLSELLEEVKNDIGGLITEHSAAILAENDVEIYANKIELRILLQNLVSNAIKYRKLNLSPVIVVYCVERSEYVEIKVEDNGVGISEENQKRIFDYEFRAKETSDREGYGFGLSHCHEIIRSHGGKFSLVSSLGVGSTFVVKLPRQESWI